MQGWGAPPKAGSMAPAGQAGDKLSYSCTKSSQAAKHPAAGSLISQPRGPTVTAVFRLNDAF